MSRSAKLNQLNRILTEQLAQTLWIGVTLIERLVLTAVILRTWGIERFEAWSLLLAVAGLLSVFEFGFNLYINNRLTAEVERGNFDTIERFYATANALLLVSAVAAIATSVLLPLLNWTPLVEGQQEDSWIAVLVMLAVGTAMRISMCGAMSLYRANRQYARLMLILISTELARILLTILVVLMGGGLLAAAIVTLITVVTGQVWFILMDTSRRFKPHRFTWAWPDRNELRQIAGTSAGYFAQNVPLVILMHAPIIMLGYSEITIGVVGTFVLVRTLTGLPRAILQSLGIVAGQECGRRVAIDDAEGAFQSFVYSARSFAVLSGLAAGFILAAGQVIGIIWTNKGNVFEIDLLAAGLIPMMLVPTSVLTHNILASSNRPAMAALGRWLQIFITLVALIALPIDDPALRMLFAMSLGEVLGFAPLSYLGTVRLVPQFEAKYHFRMIMLCLVAALLAYAVTSLLLSLVGTGLSAALFISIFASGAVCAALFWWLGLDKRMRHMLLALGTELIRGGPRNRDGV